MNNDDLQTSKMNGGMKLRIMMLLLVDEEGKDVGFVYYEGDGLGVWKMVVVMR